MSKQRKSTDGAHVPAGPVSGRTAKASRQPAAATPASQPLGNQLATRQPQIDSKPFRWAPLRQVPSAGYDAAGVDLSCLVASTMFGPAPAFEIRHESPGQRRLFSNLAFVDEFSIGFGLRHSNQGA